MTVVNTCSWHVCPIIYTVTHLHKIFNLENGCHFKVVIQSGGSGTELEHSVRTGKY